MYCSFFKLKCKPFDLIPNPDFIFLSKTHKKAITYLDYGIRERVGFILLTGEVGSGKTTIIREMIKKHLSRVVLAKVFNTSVNSEQLLYMINDDFGLAVEGKGRIELLRDLNNFLVEQYSLGNQPLLIIDEAQNLPPETLEEVRMLSNLETSDSKLLQIILVGQPELRAVLAKPELRQLRQRISVQCILQPLNRTEVEEYILHRLQVAGNREALRFSPRALDLLFIYCCGMPRLVNIVCEFLLLAAFADEVQEVDEEMMRDIIGDLDFDQYYLGRQHPTPAPAEGGGTPSPALQWNDRRIEDLLITLNQRIDDYGREVREAAQAPFKEFSEKLEQMQEGFAEQLKRADAAIEELKKRMDESPQLDPPPEVAEGPEEETDPPSKPSLIRRILGCRVLC